MTLRHLRIFVAVCTWGSITRAAEKLHMAQPSVSLAIRELEEYYQLQLFDRISRKLYLTGDGERFLKYASHITSLFDEMENSMEHWSDMESMSIGSSITIANSLLCECLHSYKLEYPKRQIQILIENSMILEESIVSNQLDLALIEGIPTHEHIQKLSFFKDELAVICARKHPLAEKQKLCLQDIAQEPFLLREKGSGTREILDSIMKVHDIQLHPIWESASTRALVKGVQFGFGISILPYQMVKAELEAGIVTRLYLSDVSFQRDYYIIYHANKHLHAGLMDFIATCRRVCAKIQAKE